MRPWVFLLLLVIEVSGAAERLATQRPYKRGEAMAGYKRPAIPFPEDNRYSREREALGRKLFFDPRLSGARNTSCATCHNPGLAWGDGLARAIGAGGKPLRRRTPTILNSGWGDLMFWDGRAESLEEQVLGPMQSADEMNLPLRELVPRVLSIPGYRPLFEKAYPGAPLTAALVAKAIATFERTVVSEDAPFDRWIGGDQAAIPEAAKRGFDLFHTKAGCSKCHLGWTFTDEGFHDIGTTGPDRGRGMLLPLEAMQHAFKTPGLREIDLRGPYMHDGAETTLEDVVEFYDLGGRVKRPGLSPEIVPLRLTAAEKQDLIAFLHTLTGPTRLVEYPVLPH